MRNVSVAMQVVAVVAVFTVSAVGQQVLVYPTPSVDLPIEPVHLKIDTTLADAARRNDFPAFDAMYRESHDAAYAELHDFWKWSLTDPIGAFYGADKYANFAAEYPDYRAFIADLAIVDSHGNVFYPSSETRQFLLRHVSAPRLPLVAVAKPRSVARPRPAHVVKVVKVAKAAPVPEPVPVPVPVPATKPIPMRVTEHVDDARFARGLALIIAGLIGVGMLTLMIRTPAEEHLEETSGGAPT